MITLKAEAAEAKRGRDHVAEIAAGWPVDVNDVRVVVGELVNNAIRHVGTGEIRVDAFADEDASEGVYVGEVWDSGSEEDLPVLRDPGSEREDGHGLWLVGALADGWGTRFDDDDGGGAVYKVVFAEWTVSFR